MIKKLLLVATVLYSTINLAQAPAIEWQKCLGGTTGDEVNSIQPTIDGGYILAGHTQSNDGDVTGNHGLFDVWVIKLSATGVLEWQKTFGGTDVDIAYSIQQTTDGGYIVAGETYSTDGDITENQGGNDVWLLKLSVSGELQWQKTFGGTDADFAFNIQQTIDGGYILVGYTSSDDGDLTGYHLDGDVWVLKLSALGALEWQKTLGGTSTDLASSIQETTDGGYILAISTPSNDGDVTGNHGLTDVWLVKLSVSGTLQWQKTLGGTSNDLASSIQQTTDGGYILTGETYSNNGDVTENQGDADAWVVKLSALGAVEWQKTFGGSSIDRASSIQQTTNGDYIVAGYTYSNDGDVTGNHGFADAWVIKLSVSGAVEWKKTLGGTDVDFAYSIQQTADGGYIMMGNTSSNDGDVTGNHGTVDFWVVKLGPELATENFDKKSCIIYPNPATNTLYIQTNQSIDKITITDITGKKVKEQNTTSNQIDVQDLQQGMYILQVFSGGKTFVEKFVKE